MAIFGDMGVYSWNNMANLAADVTAEEIDMVVHMGDHCYNIGGSDDRRGDGYMQDPNSNPNPTPNPNHARGLPKSDRQRPVAPGRW